MHCSKRFVIGEASNLKKKISENQSADLCIGQRITHEAAVIMKDNDLKEKLHLSPADAVRLFERVKRDTIFLRDLGIMDYSLLVGVSYGSAPVIANRKDVNKRSGGASAGEPHWLYGKGGAEVKGGAFSSLAHCYSL